MYDNIKYQGATLHEWADRLNNAFTLYELYCMMKEGQDFSLL